MSLRLERVRFPRPTGEELPGTERGAELLFSGTVNGVEIDLLVSAPWPCARSALVAQRVARDAPSEGLAGLRTTRIQQYRN